jgi:hypothetical protein
MSAVLAASPAGAAAGAGRRPWFDGFGRRHLFIVLAFSLAVPLTDAVFMLLVRRTFDPWSLLFDAISCAMYALVAIASAVATDNRLAGSASAPVRVTVAVLAATIVDSLLMEALIFFVVRPLGVQLEDVELVLNAGAAHRLALHFSGAASWTLLLVILYSMFEADRRATAELHSANVAAFAAEREIIEEDFRAMQARVDPDLLFDTLLGMERAYARSVASGEKALEALTAYLRAALPAEVGGTSTVARELELVGAYLALIALNEEKGRDDRISVDPAVHDAKMPAMLLLPLVRWALDASGAVGLQVTVRRGPAALEFAVQSEAAGGDASPERDLEDVQQRFRNLYGERGHIGVSIAQDARRAAMVIPL